MCRGINGLSDSGGCRRLRGPGVAAGCGIRQRGRGLGNEAGMCPGINGLIECAPIADVGEEEAIGVAHTWRLFACHVCVPGLLVSRLAHDGKSAKYVPAAYGRASTAALSPALSAA